MGDEADDDDSGRTYQTSSCRIKVIPNTDRKAGARDEMRLSYEHILEKCYSIFVESTIQKTSTIMKDGCSAGSL